jgi:hypothetical protein
MAQKKAALAKLLAVLIAVIIVLGSFVAVLFAYTWFAFQPSYANVTPSPFTVTPSPPPPSISTGTPTPGPSPPTTHPSPNTVTGTPTPTPTVVTLANAISQGLIQATFTGNGNCAGDCIELTVTSQVDYPVEITPPATGTVLTTSSADTQSMVLQELQGIDHGSTYTSTDTIELTNRNPVTYVFRAYCLDFDKANPSSTDQFSMAGTANSDVIKVLNNAATLPVSVANIDAVQTAIWVVTDNVSEQELSTTFPSGVSEVNNVRTILHAAGIDVSGKALFTSPSAT